MVGYRRKPEETRRAIEADGWLHTDDQARIGAGRIYITGRIKEIIVTSTAGRLRPSILRRRSPPIRCLSRPWWLASSAPTWQLWSS
jgi:hypothetical protein